MAINLFSLSGIVLTVTCFVLLVIILWSGKTRLHYIWSSFNFVLIIWGTSVFFIGRNSGELDPLTWWKIAHVGIILIPVFFYHVIYLLCRLNRKKSLLFVYIQGGFFLAFNFINIQGLFLSDTRLVFQAFYYFTPGYLYHLFLLFWVAIVLHGIAILFISYRKSSGIRKNQIALFLAGLCTGFLGGLANFFPVYGLNIYPVGNFGIPLYCIVATYSIVRYRLMDINLVVRKSMIYSLSAGILTSLFVALVLVMTKLLSYVAGISSFAVTVIAALIIAVLFNPVKDKIQSIIDKSFYKKSFDYYPTIRKMSRKLTSIFDLNELFTYVGETLCTTLDLRNAYLLYAFPGKGYEVVYYKLHKKDSKRIEGTDKSTDTKVIRKNSEIVQYFKKSDEILIRDELPRLERVLGREILERMNTELRPFAGETVVPVFVDKKLVLLLVLGEKISGYAFTNEDINLLNIISNQISIAIRNTELYKDKVHTERLASIGMMSATFAHEIRNPLTSLKTFAQLMPEKYNDEEFRDTFSKIVVKEIERINSLISDLLDFSADKETGRVSEFELKSFMDDIVEYVRARLELDKHNILIQKVYNTMSIDMNGDVEKLKQAFTNIFNNGCQAMNGEGVLTVDIKPNAKNVEISIKDTGEGIHPDDLSRIFDPFVTTKEMGVGLGLAISKRVIEDHKGKIGVNSKLSIGTKFTVTLPMPQA